MYAPLDWEVSRIEGPKVRAYLSCGGQVERSLGPVTGAEGAIVLWNGRSATHDIVDARYDLSAGAVDILGRPWVASAGRIWTRGLAAIEESLGLKPKWDCIWEDPTWEMPIVSICADMGGVMAMTADGGVIEGGC